MREIIIKYSVRVRKTYLLFCSSDKNMQNAQSGELSHILYRF